MSDAHPNPTANNPEELAELLHGPVVSARPEFRAELRHRLMTLQVPPSAPATPVAETAEVTRWLVGLLVAAVAVGVTLIASGLPFQYSAPTDAAAPAVVEPGGGPAAPVDGAAHRDGADDEAANADAVSEPGEVDPRPLPATPTGPTDSGPADDPADEGAAGVQQPVRPAAPLQPQATSTAMPPTAQPDEGHDNSGESTDPGNTDPGNRTDDDPTAAPATETTEPTSTRDLRTPATPPPTNTAEPSPGPRITATPGSPTPATNTQDDISPVDP